MKSFTRALVVLPLFVGCAMFCWDPALKAEQAENPVCFHWAFGAKVGPETDRKYISVQRDTTMKSGDCLKMFVELQKACFVYLIYHGSQDSLYMLFPSDYRQYDPGQKVFQKTYIPGGDQWFVLDQNVGLETFYLLASAKRLKRLESFFAQYESAVPALKTESAQNILNEIKRLRWQHRGFKKPAERPVAMMGHLRGTETSPAADDFDVAHQAVEIDTPYFYSRTFTIDHR